MKLDKLPQMTYLDITSLLQASSMSLRLQLLAEHVYIFDRTVSFQIALWVL